jgi:hypothetical protein
VVLLKDPFGLGYFVLVVLLKNPFGFGYFVLVVLLKNPFGLGYFDFQVRPPTQNSQVRSDC